MKFDDLMDFVEKRMTMNHIYQPQLIRSLVDSAGSATIRQLAQAFLAQDESQLIYYEKRIREMPVKVLSNHDIVSRDGDLVSLNTGKMTLEQKAKLRMACESKLQEFVQKRGLSIWDYRLLETDPIPDSLRYTALKESGGRCALCGVTKKERPLDVDHIKPKSRGGKHVLENLQVLCSKCNRSKGNKDDTDFRKDLTPETDPNCLFCSEKMKSRQIEVLGLVFAIMDKYPVTKGHTLVITRRHTADFFSMTSQERRDVESLIRILKKQAEQKDGSITGFNVGVNCGESAGQTIQHAHLHLIPRRDGDIKDPRGGVRGVIPKKMGY
jgi:ATP adenylyltransferase